MTDLLYLQNGKAILPLHDPFSIEGISILYPRESMDAESAEYLHMASVQLIVDGKVAFTAPVLRVPVAGGAVNVSNYPAPSLPLRRFQIPIIGKESVSVNFVDRGYEKHPELMDRLGACLHGRFT